MQADAMVVPFVLFITLALLVHSTLGSLFYDVVVYGATPGGIAAAISAATLSASVALLESSSHVGGMATEGGIGLRDGPDYIRQDTRNSQYQWGRRNAQHYGIDDGSVIWQPDNFVGEKSFLEMLQEAGVTVLLNTDFSEVRMNGTQMEAVLLTSQMETKWLEASFFIDASYEAELTVASRVVDYTFGRESSSTYNESWGGVTNHSEAQFSRPLDPFNDDGTLLRYINTQGDPQVQVGMSDDNVMAYSYRVCLTKDPRLYVPVTPPDGYNPKDFELARRLVLLELGMGRNLSQPWLALNYSGYERIPGRAFMKYDGCCGLSPVGIDAVGLARGYATARRSERIKIAAQHRYYVQGLLWFWRTDQSVPKHVREQHLEYGLCKDEWADNGHFPRQLYVREAARLVGDRVFSQNDRRHDYWRHDSIAVGSWGLDIHDMQRTAVFRQSVWWVVNEGLTGYKQNGIFPFKIPYWILLPKQQQLENLAAVSTPSVSHVAFAAIQEEPTLWNLGTAAGTAAALALSTNVVPLHDVDVRQLQHSLIEQGILIHCTNNSSWSKADVEDTMES